VHGRALDPGQVLFESPIDNSATSTPRLADSTPGNFPVGRVAHDQPGFRGAVEIRYPEGEDDAPGATTNVMTVKIKPVTMVRNRIFASPIPAL
jgi:hypothetical protein